MVQTWYQWTCWETLHRQQGLACQQDSIDVSMDADCWPRSLTWPESGAHSLAMCRLGLCCWCVQAADIMCCQAQ